MAARRKKPAAKAATDATAQKPPRWAAKFLDAFREERSVTHAANAVGKDRSTCYRHRAASPEFAAAWDQVADEHRDDLQRSAMRIAIEGVREPVFHEGVICGHKQRYHPALMIFMLKRQIPALYGDHLDRVNAPTAEPDDRVDYV